MYSAPPSRADVIARFLPKSVDISMRAYFVASKWCGERIGDELDVYWKMGDWVIGNSHGKWDAQEYENKTVRFFFHKDTPDELLVECKLRFG